MSREELWLGKSQKETRPAFGGPDSFIRMRTKMKKMKLTLVEHIIAGRCYEKNLKNVTKLLFLHKDSAADNSLPGAGRNMLAKPGAA